MVNFSQDSYLDQDFTSDINLLQQALQKASAAGSTALYDAIVASAVHVKNNTRVDRKVLLVITDGRDNASQETLQQATRGTCRQMDPQSMPLACLATNCNNRGSPPNINRLARCPLAQYRHSEQPEISAGSEPNGRS